MVPARGWIITLSDHDRDTHTRRRLRRPPHSPPFDLLLPPTGHDDPTRPDARAAPASQPAARVPRVLCAAPSRHALTGPPTPETRARLPVCLNAAPASVHLSVCAASGARPGTPNRARANHLERELDPRCRRLLAACCPSSSVRYALLPRTCAPQRPPPRAPACRRPARGARRSILVPTPAVQRLPCAFVLTTTTYIRTNRPSIPSRPVPTHPDHSD
ncbi:hypothetical protein C8J57DRAFT_1490335 [Mycena rebaudengoi]|nr:hypothetical protein C8J57DRAFT_1490335 [Mycena rebaudengoi]